MDLNSISDFIDLVKNPDKYSKLLQGIKDEQDRLNAVIETVGKASQLDKLRKEVESQKEALELDYQARQTELERQVNVEVEILAKKKQDLDALIKQAKDQLNDAIEKSDVAKALSFQIEQREAALKTKEADIAARNAQVEAAQIEVTERLSKLRSVMG